MNAHHDYTRELLAALASAPERQAAEGDDGPDLEPYYDRVVVKMVNPEDKSPGGIILPAIAVENSPYRYGVVMAVGHGRMTANGEIVPMRLKKGDVVMFARVQNGEQFALPALDGTQKNWFVIREPHVVGRITNPKRISHLVDGGGSALSLHGGQP